MANHGYTLDHRVLEGVSRTSLSHLFGMSYQTVVRRLGPLAPSGYRGDSPIYRVAAAAPYLIDKVLPEPEPEEEEEPPPMSQSEIKDMWDSRLKEQKFLENAGDLWRTVDVVEALAEIFKTIKLQVLLLTDNVEREVGLTEEQRRLIQAQADQMLEGLKEMLEEKYADRKPDIVE